MIDIAVSQDDEPQFVGSAACCGELGLESVPLAREAGVDEDVAVLNLDEVAVHAEIEPANPANHVVSPGAPV